MSIIQCKRCNKSLEESLFHVNKKTKTGRVGKCKICTKILNEDNYKKRYALNREEIIKKAVSYQKNRRKTDELYYWRHRLSKKSSLSLKATGEKPTVASVIKLFGANVSFVKKYLSEKFKEGMSWDNRGVYWEVDHIIPLCKAKDIEDLYNLCHYTNLQPLLKQENRSKAGRY